MAFQHKPKEETDVLPKGIYDAVVMDAKERTSKKGNNMLELKVKVFAPGGDSILVYDYLVDIETQAWKIRHFCDSAGLNYNLGTIEAEQARNANIKVNLIIEDSPEYGRQNKVKDFIPRDGGMGDSRQTASEIRSEVTDEDLPF